MSLLAEIERLSSLIAAVTRAVTSVTSLAAKTAPVVTKHDAITANAEEDHRNENRGRDIKVIECISNI
jgi:hypothetical protein